MKSKLTLLAVTMCLLALTFAQAQTATVASTTIKGTPYLDDTYAQGVIFFANNKRTAPVRYNVYKDLIEYKQDGIARVLDPTTTVKKVCLDSATFVVEKYEFKGEPRFGYFQVLDSGRVKLYAKKIVRYIPVLKGRAIDGTDKPAEFKRSPDEFYFKVDDVVLQEVKSMKSFIAAFPDKNDELSKFAKQEKISPRNQDELIRLLQYYNSL